MLKDWNAESGYGGVIEFPITIEILRMNPDYRKTYKIIHSKNCSAQPPVEACF